MAIFNLHDTYTNPHDNATVDVRSDTQWYDQERTHTRDNNESGAGFQKDHGETTELARACDEERRITHDEESA